MQVKMKLILALLFVAWTAEGSLSRHDRRGSRLIYDPKALLDQLQVKTEQPETDPDSEDQAEVEVEEEARFHRQTGLSRDDVTGSTGRSARLRARQPIPAAFDPIQDEPRAQIPNPLIGDPFFADLAIADDGSYAYANPGGFTNFNGFGQPLLANPFPRPALKSYPAVPGEDDAAALSRDLAQQGRFPGAPLGLAPGFGGPNPQLGGAGLAGFGAGPFVQYPGVGGLTGSNFGNFGAGLGPNLGGRPGFPGQVGLLDQSYLGFGVTNNGLGISPLTTRPGLGFQHNALGADSFGQPYLGFNSVELGSGTGFAGNRPSLQQGSFGGLPLNQGVAGNQGFLLSQSVPLGQDGSFNQGSPLNQRGVVNQGFPVAQNVGLNQGFQLSQGTGISQGLPFGQGVGLNQGFGLPQDTGITGFPYSQGVGFNQGFPFSQGAGLNQAFAFNQGTGLNQGFPLTQGTDLNQGFALSQGNGLNQGFALSQGTGLNQGFPFSQGSGLSQGLPGQPFNQGAISGLRPNTLSGSGFSNSPARNIS